MIQYVLLRRKPPVKELLRFRVEDFEAVSVWHTRIEAEYAIPEGANPEDYRIDRVETK